MQFVVYVFEFGVILWLLMAAPIFNTFFLYSFALIINMLMIYLSPFVQNHQSTFSFFSRKSSIIFLYEYLQSQTKYNKYLGIKLIKGGKASIQEPLSKATADCSLHLLTWQLQETLNLQSNEYNKAGKCYTSI
jgi:hypothetical protein